MNLSNLKVSKVSYETVLEAASAMQLDTATTQNMTSTAAQAPYFVRVIPNGTWSLDDQASAVAREMGCQFEKARYWWSALMETVAAVLTDGVHTSVEFGYWRFALEIAGSIPSSNSQCNAVDNPVWIAVYPSAELQAVAASIDTKADVSQQPFIIDCVFGANGERYLTGGTSALIMGRGFSAPTSVKLVRGTTSYDCMYDPVEGDLPTRIRVVLPAIAATAKDYRLEITATGQAGTAPVTIAKENVTVKAGTPPTPTSDPTFTRVDGPKTTDGKIILKRTGSTELTIVGTNMRPLLATEVLIVQDSAFSFGYTIGQITTKSMKLTITEVEEGATGGAFNISIIRGGVEIAGLAPEYVVQ